MLGTLGGDITLNDEQSKAVTRESIRIKLVEINELTKLLEREIYEKRNLSQKSKKDVEKVKQANTVIKEGIEDLGNLIQQTKKMYSDIEENSNPLNEPQTKWKAFYNEQVSNLPYEDIKLKLANNPDSSIEMSNDNIL